MVRRMMVYCNGMLDGTQNDGNVMVRTRHLGWSRPRTTLRYVGDVCEDIIKHTSRPSFPYSNERELKRKRFSLTLQSITFYYTV